MNLYGLRFYTHLLKYSFTYYRIYRFSLQRTNNNIVFKFLLYVIKELNLIYF